VTRLPTIEATHRPPASASQSRQVNNRRFAGAVIACSVVAAILAWYRIRHDSFWLDEAASLRFARETDWTDILSESNGNMTAYLGALKLWLPHATSEAAVRFLSAIPFVLTVPTVAFLGRRVGGARVGVLAAALTATHPFLVRYGQEARGFSLVAFLITAAALALVVGIQDQRRSILLAGVVLLGVAPYAHPVAALTAILLIAWLWWAPVEALPVRRAWVPCIFAAMVAPLALLIVRAGSRSLSWTGRGRAGGVASLLSVVWENASGTLGGLVIGAAAAAGCVLAVGAIRRRGRTVDGWVAGVPLVWVVGTGILVIAASLRQSLLVPRYELLVVPGVALLAATVSLQVSWSRPATMLLIGAAVFNTAVIVERGGTYRAEDWREAQAFVSEMARPADGIVFAPTPKSVSYEYYQVRHDRVLPEPVLPPGQWGDVEVNFDRLVRDRPEVVAGSAETIARHNRMWLVVATGPGGGPRQAFLQAARDALSSAREPAGSWQFGRVNVELYAPR
jgi:mannosyltransferase